MEDLILGVHCGHNASVALMTEGRILSAIQEERLSRIKNHTAYPFLSTESILDFSEVTKKQIRYIGFGNSEFPSRYFLAPFPIRKRIKEGYRILRRDMKFTLYDMLDKKYLFKERLTGVHKISAFIENSGQTLQDVFNQRLFEKRHGYSDVDVEFVHHHLGHALSAYYFSAFRECLIVTIDGMGDKISHASWAAKDGKFEVLSSTPIIFSPGFFYGEITVLLGFQMLRHEGKVTGLAAYGNPHKLYGEMAKAFRLRKDKMGFEGDFTGQGERGKHLAKVIQGCSREDVSASAQLALENAIVGHIQHLSLKKGLRKVALSGGVFANVKLNQRIMELTEVDEIFVFPGMGDEGLSTGVAIFQHLKHYGQDTCHRIDNLYWGPSFSEDEIRPLLEKGHWDYDKMNSRDRAKIIARLIHEGKIVGIFQGRLEFGPRALGNRSILAAPTDPSINDTLNKRLSRSEFMPFAPSVLDKAAPDIFKNFAKGSYTSKFMTVTFDLHEDWAKKIPAVVHVDGTARPQVVSERDNPRYYGIIQEYFTLSGLPAILNTSFNVHEEPIVCQPQEALRALAENRIDVLVLEDYLVYRGI